MPVECRHHTHLYSGSQLPSFWGSDHWDWVPRDRPVTDTTAMAAVVCNTCYPRMQAHTCQPKGTKGPVLTTGSAVTLTLAQSMDRAPEQQVA